MSGATRLPPQPGEWIDRSQSVAFSFEGRNYTGYAGDTITSALLAAGVTLLGRSFKYHRPRSAYSASNHDVNVMLEDDRDTNIRGDVTPIRAGAAYRAVNTFGGLEGDKLQIMDKLGRFLPVGFYYKTFFRPQSAFPFWEKQMRAAAGLGNVDPKRPAGKSPKRYDWCDVCVIGAGPAGLAAAIAAAQAGAQTLCVDENPRPGGSLTYQSGGSEILADLLGQAAALKNLEIRMGTLAGGYYGDHWIGLVDEIRLTKLRAGRVVIAQGAHEQPAVFRHNDLPGVMLASGAQRLIRRYAVRPFQSAVVLAANADGYRAALDFHAAGVRVAALVDLRPGGEPSEVAAAVKQAGITVRTGATIYAAQPAAGHRGIQGVLVCPVDAAGKADAARTETIACDGVAMSVGWSGADGLLYQAGGRMAYSDELQQFVPRSLPDGVFAAGRVNGVFDRAARLADGTRAGRAAAGAAAGEPVPQGPPSTHPYPIVYHPDGKAFVDFDEDVQLKDLIHAEREGFDNIELLKRYSTFGMGPSQGKIANTNTIRILAKLRGQGVGQTGSPTSRPFWHPVPIGHLGGRGFHPHRHTPLHSRHVAAKAVVMAAGEWVRPAYYARAGQTREECIRAEVEAVRRAAGIIDVGTLGKLEISGPDAGAFIERIYTGKFASMKIGATRYGLMCDESGVIIDDGVVGRLAEDRFYVTTTTTASGPVYREMQRHALVWGMNVTLVNATGLYAGMNLAGPLVRSLLQSLTDIDLSEAAFPFLGMREGTVAGVSARLLRVGFVGELGYELHVPAYGAARVWDAIRAVGEAAKTPVTPFGVEAQRVLRLEKGHAIVSQDTDGLSTPFEAGMAWAIKDDKPFFIGQRSLRIVGQKPLTRTLVGFTLGADYRGALPKECHLVIESGAIVGRVTSIAASPTLGQPIGLAYVAPHQSSVGSTFQIRIDEGAMVTATVAALPFYDPKHERQKSP